jgi:diadenosine tetraphosphatase ApaH/serine/threonine PP2A family protein phosphatase
MEHSAGYEVLDTRPETANGSSSTLSSLQRDLDALIDGMALLGVKRCTQCGQFFRSADAGALFDGGELICYGCVPNWWATQSPEMNAPDRKRLEARLATWMRKNHEAQVIKDPAKVPDPNRCVIQLTTGCAECGSTGKLLEGERCRFCNGLGSVFVVVLKPTARVAGLQTP